MLAPARIVKENAKIAIRGKMFIGCVASAVFLCAVLPGLFLADILGFVSGSSGLTLALYIAFATLVALPLFFGLLKFFWHIIFGTTENVSFIFCYFSSMRMYKRAFGLSYRLVLRMVAFAIICSLPKMWLDMFVNSSVYNSVGEAVPEFVGNLWVVEALLSVLGIIIWVLISARLYIAPFLLVVDDEAFPSTVIRKAYVISKRTYSDFIWLLVAFLGWIVLSLTGIPLIFLLPYFVTAYLVHCRFAVADYNKSINFVCPYIVL